MTAPIVWPQTRKPIHPETLAGLANLGRVKEREALANGAPLRAEGQLWSRLAERAETHQ